MIDRRLFIGGASAAALSACATRPPSSALAAMIDRSVPPGFNGAIAVAARGRVRIERWFGLADVERAAPITAATRFAIGSASKWLTSVAVLQLVDQGRLDLDRPVGNWLPSIGADAGARVTLRHLLSNRSGISDVLGAAVKAEPALRSSDVSAAAMVERLGGRPLAHKPGTHWNYDAFNWVIVSAVVANVAGTPFDEAMARLVFRPLGLGTAALSSSGFDRVPAMAAGYRSLSPPLRKMNRVPAFVAASGNMVMTPREALRAAHGVFSTQFLSARSRTALTTVLVAAQEYALGGRVRAIGAGRWGWETGKVEAYRALIAHDLDRDVSIVIFANDDRSQDDLAATAEAIAPFI